jgi:hypothetical protein
LPPARAFLERVRQSFDTAVEAAYRSVQLAGREAFKDSLREDIMFWISCQRRWGGGPHYQEDIRDMTGEKFESSYDDAHQLVRNRISEEWDQIVLILEGLLKEQAVPAAPVKQ